MPKTIIKLSSAGLGEVTYPNPIPSKIDLDRKLIAESERGWSDVSPHEAAIDIICIPTAISMFICCENAMEKSSMPDRDTIDRAICMGLLASLALLPLTAPVAVAVGGGKLLYDGCLFGKKKIEKYLEYSASENECRQSPN